MMRKRKLRHSIHN